MDMGKLICVADPDEAAPATRRSSPTYDGGVTDIPPFPPITDGIVLAGITGRGRAVRPGRGRATDGGRMRFDDAVGAGWRLVTLVEPGHRRTTSPTGSRASAGRSSPLGCGDHAGSSTSTAPIATWFADHGVVAALQRPDFVVFGTAATPSEITGAAARACAARCSST